LTLTSTLPKTQRQLDATAKLPRRNLIVICWTLCVLLAAKQCGLLAHIWPLVLLVQPQVRLLAVLELSPALSLA
jgi:hypothetical protein